MDKSVFVIHLIRFEFMKNKVLGSTLIIAGTAVGAGMLAIDIAVGIIDIYCGVVC